MELRPCGQCRRHVDTVEARCPFCQEVLAPAPSRVVVVRRLSRAAVFASATLASGCWTSSPPTQTTPIEEQTRAPEVAIPAGEIQGIVRDAATGAPLVGVRVVLYQHDSRAEVHGLTDDKGAYVFSGLSPGPYTIRYRPNHPRHAPSEVAVTLSPRAGAHVDLSVHVPRAVRDPHNVPMPYGAPPARRRIV